MRSLRWTMGIGIACAALLACEKSSEQQKREADKAVAEAQEKASQATSEAEQKTRDAREKADREREELHATVLREKSDYRAKIRDAIGRIEKDLTDEKVDLGALPRGDRSKDKALLGKEHAKTFEKIESQLARRDRLMDDSDKIDSTIEHDWSALKDRIDRDLEGKEAEPARKPGRT